MKRIKTQLKELALERREKNITVEMSRFDPSRVYPVPWFGFRSIYSHTLEKPKRRFINARRCLDLGGVLETPTAIARDYLRLIYRRGPGLRGQAKEIVPAIVAKRSPALPLYAAPCEFGEGFYLDIFHCYWSLMGVSGWNVAYLPGKYLLGGRPPFDFPFPESSVARNSLVSCAAPNEMVKYYPPKPKGVPIGNYNPVLNESLILLIRDVLHCIASEAVKMGAVYWHTDGCIAPNIQTAERIEKMVADWGLSIRYEAIGPGAVLGIGAYRVGEKITKATDRRPSGLNGVLSLEYSDWLQKCFARFARYRRSK